MGQQQIYLVIIVAIIVSIATFLALNVLGSGSKQSNYNAVRQDLAQIASSSQTWYARPTFMGGGNNSFSNISFSQIPFQGEILEGSNGLISTNINGTYWIREINTADIFVRGYPATEKGYIVGETPSLGWFEARIYRNGFTIGIELDADP